MTRLPKNVAIGALIFFASVTAVLTIPYSCVSARHLPEILPGFITPGGTAGTIDVTVRDSRTGRRVAADLSSISTDGSVSRAVADNFGKGTLSGKGRTEISITAHGYKPLDTYFILGGNTLEIIVYIDPLETTAYNRTETRNQQRLDGQTLIHGNIYAKDGAPITSASVYLRSFGAVAKTDEAGYFRLFVPTPAVNPVGDMPGSSDLVVEKEGQEVYVYSDMLIPAGTIHLILDAKDKVTTFVRDVQKLRMSSEAQQNAQDEVSPITEESQRASQLDFVAAPPSIRVGSNCPSGRTSCTVFTVYTLDAYVRFGLDDEWISSWNANSLKAGAIAYRSYGAYFVYHPINAANYDICNTTSCQVCDPADSATSTNNAANQTTGSIVTNSTSTDVLFAEYSAENNLGGCPDGFTGNNGTWPCLSDQVDVGQAFFGHGRGMCQWGTQRWSINQGKDFVWIVNHYYNANGNPNGLRNGILQLGPDTLLPPPELSEPGNITAPGVTISSLTPTFQWQESNGGDGYSLYISRFNGSTYDLVFNSETALAQPITGTSFTIPTGILVADGQYRWNMSTHIGAGYGTPNTFRNYFTVNPAAAATVSGRVTSPSGIGVRNAVVSITDSRGIRRTATTSSFGFYSLVGVNVGETQTISVNTKRFRFTPQILQINGNVSGLDFAGLE